jgi:hypothetical protein
MLDNRVLSLKIIKYNFMVHDQGNCKVPNAMSQCIVVNGNTPVATVTACNSLSVTARMNTSEPSLAQDVIF